MNIKYKNLISVIILGSTQTALANDSATEKAIESLFPKTLSSMVSQEDGSQLTLTNGGLDYSYQEAKFNKNKGETDLVVLFRARIATADSSCIVAVIKMLNNKPILADSTVLKDEDEIANCDDIALEDFDGDGIPEVLVNTIDHRGNPAKSMIYRWQGSRLVNITPSIVLNGATVSALRGYELTTMKYGNSQVIIDTPNASFGSDTTTKTYALANGQFALLGTYDFFQIIDMKSLKGGSIAYNPGFAAEGTYTLDVKNISDHNRAVRVEVTVNGSVVLKPQDFCSAPTHAKTDKNWWGGHDDDDDNNFDNCKRCVPKNEAYAIVNMKTANEIKVKVYGMGNSKVQLTLVKK